jgi:hypothetical protein
VLLVALAFPLSALADDATAVTDPPATAVTTDPLTTTTTTPADTTTTAPPADASAPATDPAAPPAGPVATDPATATPPPADASAPAAPPAEEQPATPAAPPSSSAPPATPPVATAPPATPPVATPPPATPPPAATAPPEAPATPPAPATGVEVPGVGGIVVTLPSDPAAPPAPIEVTPVLGAPADPIVRVPVTVIVPIATPPAPPATPPAPVLTGRTTAPIATGGPSTDGPDALIPGPVTPPAASDATAITRAALHALAAPPAAMPFGDAQDAATVLSRQAAGLATGPVVGEDHDPAAAPRVSVVTPPAPASGSNPFLAKITPAGGGGFGGSSLLAVLAGYVLPGGGTMPGSTLFLFLMQLGLLALVAFAPARRGFERVVAIGLLAGRPGHQMAVRRPG